MSSSFRQSPKAVFFDWDGTLVDTYAFLESAHDAVRVRLALKPLEKGEFKLYFGQQREWVYAQLYGSKTEEAKRFFEQYVAENLHLLKRVEGVEDFLNCLEKLGIKLGVVSNKKKELIINEIIHLGWQQRFAVVIGAGEAVQDKPGPEPLLLALEQGGLQPDPVHVWYVGDTALDLECAQRAGCRPVILSHKENRAFEEKKVQKNVFFSNFDEIIAFFGLQKPN